MFPFQYRTNFASPQVHLKQKALKNRKPAKSDVNHPSVIIWDNGNEGGWNYDVDKVFEANDPQKRIVIHPWADFNGWDTHHYPTYLTGMHRFNAGENVFFPTEFMHGTYDNGHGAALEDFWNRYKESPLFAGGFMWAMLDEAVKRSDWTGDVSSVHEFSREKYIFSGIKAVHSG